MKEQEEELKTDFAVVAFVAAVLLVSMCPTCLVMEPEVMLSVMMTMVTLLPRVYGRARVICLLAWCGGEGRGGGGGGEGVHDTTIL